MRGDLRLVPLLAMLALVASGCGQMVSGPTVVKVIDESGRPVEGASITDLLSGAVYVTNREGQVEVSWKDGETPTAVLGGPALFPDTIQVAVRSNRAALRVYRIPTSDGIYGVTEAGYFRIDEVPLSRRKQPRLEERPANETVHAMGTGPVLTGPIKGFLVKGSIPFSLIKANEPTMELQTTILQGREILVELHEEAYSESFKLSGGWTLVVPQIEPGAYAFLEMVEVSGVAYVSAEDLAAVKRARSIGERAEETVSETFDRIPQPSEGALSGYIATLKQEVESTAQAVQEAENQWEQAINSGPASSSQGEFYARLSGNVASVLTGDKSHQQRADRMIEQSRSNAREQRMMSIDMYESNYRLAADRHSSAQSRYNQAILQGIVERTQRMNYELDAAMAAQDERRRIIDEGAAAAARIAWARSTAQVHQVVSGTSCYPFTVR